MRRLERDLPGFLSRVPAECPYTIEQIISSGDEDWFRFDAHKDQRFSIDCQPLPKHSLALPVVDEDRKLTGVITADDIISVLREK